MDLLQNAPAHYACGPNQPGVNLEVSPNVGWANAMPDADAVVNFTIGGRALQFNGVGYHDKVSLNSTFILALQNYLY